QAFLAICTSISSSLRSSPISCPSSSKEWSFRILPSWVGSRMGRGSIAPGLLLNLQPVRELPHALERGEFLVEVPLQPPHHVLPARRELELEQPLEVGNDLAELVLGQVGLGLLVVRPLERLGIEGMGREHDGLHALFHREIEEVEAADAHDVQDHRVVGRGLQLPLGLLEGGGPLEGAARAGSHDLLLQHVQDVRLVVHGQDPLAVQRRLRHGALSRDVPGSAHPMAGYSVTRREGGQPTRRRATALTTSARNLLDSSVVSAVGGDHVLDRQRRGNAMRLPVGLLVSLAVLSVTPASAGPDGQMTLVLNISTAARWFDPSESEALITPFLFYFMIHDALVKPLPGQPMAPC